MPYAKTKSHNGKDGWITGTASGEGTFDNPVEISEDVEPADPSRVKEAPRLQSDGTVKIEKTGTNIQPEPGEAKDRLLRKAKQDWNFSRGQVRKLLKKYALYEYLDGGNYEAAKEEVDDAVEGGDIEPAQAQWIKDMLDGKT